MTTASKSNGLSNGLPPHSLETERAILGAVLFDNAALTRLQGVLEASDFYAPKHKILYEAFVALAETRTGIDYATVADYLKKKKLFNQDIGQYIIGLLDATSTSASVMYHAKIVRRLSACRQIAGECEELIKVALGQPVDVEEALNEGVSGLQKILNRGQMETTTQIGDAAEAALNERLSPEENYIVTPFVLPSFKRALGKIVTGQYIVLGGKPGAGKTSLAIQQAVFTAQRGKGVLFFSLEMTKSEIALRALQQLSGVCVSDIRAGIMETPSYDALITALGELRRIPLYVIDACAPLKPSQLKAKIEAEKGKRSIDLVIVDSLQLRKSDARKATLREEIVEITKTNKATAVECKVALLEISQLNRAASDPPKLSDFKESGSIEYDVDTALVLSESGSQENTATILIQVLKNRTGGTMEAEAVFVKSQTRFYEKEGE